MTKLEKDFENELVRWVEKELKGEALKLKLDGRRGFLDRTILLPGGVAVFMECKKNESANRRPQQISWAWRLQELGFTADFVWNMDDVKRLVEAVHG